MAADSKETTIAGKTFEMSRVVDAPRDLLFKVCTEREHLAHWWGPKGFVLDVFKFEPKPGGVFHFKMSGPSMEMWGKWIIREIKAPEKLVFVSISLILIVVLQDTQWRRSAVGNTMYVDI